MAQHNLPTRRTRAEAAPSHKPQALKPVSLSEQLKKIIRHPVIVLACVAACAILGAVASLFTATRYEATSTVVVYALTQDPNAAASNQTSVNIDTEASVAGSQEVARRAAEQLDSSDPELTGKIKSSMAVAAHSGTAILDFTATANSAEDAATYANAMAEAYLEVRQSSLQSSVDSTAEEIRDSLSSLGEGDTATRNALQEKLAQVEVTSTTAGRVVTQAQTPQSAKSLSVGKYMLVGAVMGALIGMVAARVVDSRTRTIAYPDRLEDMVGNIHLVRQQHAVEDTRRLLRSLGAPGGEFTAAGLRGLVIYSDSQQTGQSFAGSIAEAISNRRVHFLDSLQGLSPAESGNTDAEMEPTVVLAPVDTEFSQVFDAADILGSCVLVVSNTSSVDEVREFVAVAETSAATIEYVYLAN